MFESAFPHFKKCNEQIHNGGSACSSRILGSYYIDFIILFSSKTGSLVKTILPPTGTIKFLSVD